MKAKLRKTVFKLATFLMSKKKIIKTKLSYLTFTISNKRSQRNWIFYKLLFFS